MRGATRRRLGIICRITLVAMAWGALYGWLVSGRMPSGPLSGLLTGLIIAAGISSFEMLGMRTGLGIALRRRPFLQLLAVKTTIYVTIVTIGELVSIPGFGAALLYQVLANLAVALAFNFVMQINLMLGQGELVKFLGGRYSRPREEERIFLFLDLVGSTSIAETIGGIRFLEFLNQIYDDIADSILEHRGEIHKYVGDEVIVTWPPSVGLPKAGCIACAVAIERRLAETGAGYRERFGVVPVFRCGLHLGTVASGELGSVKREIAYLGDAINTTARLIEAARTARRSIVASDDLLRRLELPQGMAAESLGSMTLRGKREPMLLYAVRPIPLELEADSRAGIGNAGIMAAEVGIRDVIDHQ